MDGATISTSSALQQQCERGNVLLGLSLLASIWIFSIPPEFRRAYFCATPSCVEQRAACNDCVTFSEWKTRLGEYYRNGGKPDMEYADKNVTGLYRMIMNVRGLILSFARDFLFLQVEFSLIFPSTQKQSSFGPILCHEGVCGARERCTIFAGVFRHEKGTTFYFQKEVHYVRKQKSMNKEFTRVYP
jgi:hypothetical protein